MLRNVTPPQASGPGSFYGHQSGPISHLTKGNWCHQLLDRRGYAFWVATLREQRLLFINQVFEVVWGLPSSVVLATFEQLVAVIHPDDRVRWMAAATNPDGREIEYRICHPDGAVCWIRESLLSIGCEAGQPTHVAGVAKDITASRRTGDVHCESEGVSEILQSRPIAKLHR